MWRRWKSWRSRRGLAKVFDDLGISDDAVGLNAKMPKSPKDDEPQKRTIPDWGFKATMSDDKKSRILPGFTMIVDGMPPGYGFGVPQLGVPQPKDPKDVALDAARVKLAQQDALLNKITTAAHMMGTVIALRGARMIVVSGGAQYDVNTFAGAKIGDVVALSADSMQVLSILDGVQAPGVIATVQNDLGDGKIEIEYGGLRVVRSGQTTVGPGDRVRIDSSLSVVLENLGKPKSLLAFEKSTGTTWDDIGGHEEAKRVLRDAIETPVLHPDLFLKYNRKPTKGVLLAGPPGVGKTLMARAAATALAKVHGIDVSPGFIYVKGPALLSKWVGESESSVRAIFSAARDHKKTYGYPAIVFIDEAEAVLGRRGGGYNNIITQTLVPQFLAEMDGLEDSGALVLLATNRPGDLDPAVTRDGRIDRKVLIGRPRREDTERIAMIHLRCKPLAGDLTARDLAAVIAEQIHGEEIGKFVFDTFTTSIYLSTFSSGAMIAGIVESSAESALNRDVASGSFSGIGVEDAKNGYKLALRGLFATGFDIGEMAQEILQTHPELLTGAAHGVSPSLSLHSKVKESESN